MSPAPINEKKTIITALQQKPKSLAVSLPRSAEDYDLASRVQLMIILTYM